MNAVLLLVDLQNDFLRDGQLEPHCESVVAGAAHLLEGFRRANKPVIHVRTTINANAGNPMPHWKRSGRIACLQGSDGHRFPATLQPSEGESVIDKTFFSGFSSEELDSILRRMQPEVVVIAGVHLHGCVRATALDAYQRNYNVIVAADATGTNDPLHGAITKRYLQDRAATFLSSREIVNRLAAGKKSNDGHKPDLEIEHCSPQNPARRWSFPTAQVDTIDTAVAAAKSALVSWPAAGAIKRFALLKNFREQLRQSEEELVDFLVEDIGKPVRYARMEVARAMALIDALEKQIEPEPFFKETGFRREPLGLIALISPFNNPLAIPVGKFVPALLFGNTVIWKPAVAGSRIAEKTLQLFQRAGGSEALQIVLGNGKVARDLMSKCDAVTISGSLSAGRAAQEICAAKHLPLQAELGGNNASIVWHDADLEGAAGKIAEGAFAFAGQRCTANRRVIVDLKIHDAFLAQLISASSRLGWGDPANEQTQIGPLINAAARERAEATLDRARAASFRVITPHGKSFRQSGGAWLRPAIVCCDDPEAEIVQEETFAPVLVVQQARDWEEAIALCNRVRQGLVAAIFSDSAERVHNFLQRMRAGVLKVNSSTADAAVDLPFGGWKASGIGPPEHGVANREFFRRMQTIYFS